MWIILEQQIHVAARIKSLGQPRTIREAGLHLRNDRLLRRVVALVAGQLHQQIHAPSASLVIGVRQGIQLALRQTMQFPVAFGGRGEKSIAARFFHIGLPGQGAVFVFCVGEMASVVQSIGVCTALLRGQRCEGPVRGKLAARHPGFDAQRVVQVNVLEELLCLVVMPSHSLSLGKGELEVRAAGNRLLAVRVQRAERRLRVALLHQKIRPQNRYAVHENAVGILLHIVVEDQLGLGQLIALQKGLRGEVVGVVGEGAIRLSFGGVGKVRGTEGAHSLRKFALEQVGMAQSQECRGRGFSGVAVRVAGNARIGGRRGSLGKLLGHRAQLR